jgi:hypothetical protein
MVERSPTRIVSIVMIEKMFLVKRF